MIELGLVLDLLRLLMPSRPFSRVLSETLVICITVYYYNDDIQLTIDHDALLWRPLYPISPTISFR